ncbi:MAG: cyclic nucleotide-binding domain-containing protein [Gammaproteobacteria bacterium]|nr:cyclic nucleotide-binding domain-containing protein [Gammaproteobacteria bacterium]
MNLKSENFNFIKNSQLFVGLSDKQLLKIMPLVSIKNFSAYDIIIKENDINDNIYLLKNGCVEVIKQESSSQSHRIATLYEGAVIGEVSALDHAPRSASIVALTDCVVFEISVPELKSFSENDFNSVLNKLNRFLTGGKTVLPLFSIVIKNLTTAVKERIRESNKAMVEGLKKELLLLKERNAMGRLIINTVASLCIYMLIIQVLQQFASKLPDSSFITIPLLVVFSLGTFAMIKQSGYPLSLYGLTFHGWKASLKDSIIYTGIFAIICVFYKWELIHHSANYIGQPLFQLGFGGKFPEHAYLIKTALILGYIIFVPAQEFIMRGALQSSFYEFFRGKHKTFWSIILSNLFFSITHLHLSLAFSFIALLPGLFWGWLYSRNRTLVGVISSHIFIGVWGFFIVGVF